MAKQYKGSIMLLLTAMIWGAAFVAQSVSMDYIGPFTFQGVRSVLGAVVLLPVIAVFSGKDRGGQGEKRPPVDKKTQWIAGLLCGCVFFAACSLQQHGLVYTSAGKAGFITALYIVLVPITGLFFRRKVGWNVWVGVAIAVAGLYLLCVTESFSVGWGDFLVLLGSFAFGAHILVIDHFTGRVDGVKLSCMQFAVNAVLCGVGMLLFEQPSLDALLDCWMPICYSGILSGGLAYTLQIIGQRDTDPTVASLLLSLESVFAVIFGVLLLGEAMSGREAMGCVLMFAAIVLAQLPLQKRARA